ncbi:hypothetical protein ACFST9_14935 [Hymenobacter monticola]|uniref:Uncharacterized protein n=2 Tax=Hymenobacter monticola TaxID=1705399 RepID=A0ABY4B1D0_9BACT|nr:hypothetical protein [Hymenobacter monticola]UOE32790.1 hypothetical protein MTP16_16840 [Hymenobacter monticola]
MKAKLTRMFMITALLIGLFAGTSHGQAFTIESLDGSKQLIEVMPLNYGASLTIKCANTAIHIENINHLDTVHLLNKNFLLVAYSFRAGSGMHAAKTLVLSVRNQTLYESMHINSTFNEEFMDWSKPTPALIKASAKKTIHEAALNLTGNSIGTYKLAIKFHDERKLVNKPKPDYQHDITTVLTFDQNRNVFRSSEKNISQDFIIVGAKIKNETKKKINGAFPIINLGEEKYCYAGGEWYEWNSSYLIQQSYR